jgi:hypothetical protein
MAPPALGFVGRHSSLLVRRCDGCRCYGRHGLAASYISHKFFLGYDYKDLPEGKVLFFYIMMTLLTAALPVGLAKIAGPSGD